MSFVIRYAASAEHQPQTTGGLSVSPVQAKPRSPTSRARLRAGSFRSGDRTTREQRRKSSGHRSGGHADPGSRGDLRHRLPRHLRDPGAELRSKLAEADASLRVVKNSLTERAADQAGAEQLKEHLEGPTAFTFVRGRRRAGRQGHRQLPQGVRAPGLQGRGHERRPAHGRPDRGHRQAAGARRARRPPGGHPGLAGHRPGQRPEQPIQGLALQLGQMAEQGLVSGEAPPAPRSRPRSCSRGGRRRHAASRRGSTRKRAEAEAEAERDDQTEPQRRALRGRTDKEG